MSIAFDRQRSNSTCKPVSGIGRVSRVTAKPPPEGADAQALPNILGPLSMPVPFGLERLNSVEIAAKFCVTNADARSVCGS